MINDYTYLLLQCKSIVLFDQAADQHHNEKSPTMHSESNVQLASDSNVINDQIKDFDDLIYNWDYENVFIILL